MEPNPSPSISSIRTTKRKLEDAIRTLDGAVAPSLLATAVERPTPSKRPHIARSVYSTLARFGTASKERSRPSYNNAPTIDVSKSAPRLAAILARSASQPKQSPSLDRLSTPAHPASEYRPSSTDSFLSRLSTYKITTYANKPSQIDAVAAARCGWINDGRDRLVCGMCDVSWVLAGREGMSKEAATALVEKQRASLVEMHKDGCPWKARQCEPSVYRVPLKTPTAMVRELRAIALSLEPIVANVTVKHPLTTLQLSSLRSIFSVVVTEMWTLEHESAMNTDEIAHPIIPSDTAIVVALFGWSSAPITRRNELRCSTSSLSVSRTGSHGPSASMPPTPSLSCTSSVSNHFRQRASTPIPSASSRTKTSQFSASPVLVGSASRTNNPCLSNATVTAVSRDTSLVYCALCQRRVGLWGYSRDEATTTLGHNENFAPASWAHPKEFDPVKEHRSYCPYVVPSSIVPSLAHLPMMDSLGNAIEGWRAVLTIVQRYGLSQRQRLSRLLPSNDTCGQTPSAELKGVDDMMTGVKTNGGRELLKYVKGLLG